MAVFSPFFFFNPEMGYSPLNRESAVLPISVFPVPGGPNSRIPLGGPLNPVNRSLECCVLI